MKLRKPTECERDMATVLFFAAAFLILKTTGVIV